MKRARINDVLAFLTALLVIGLDQWSKALVVANLSPADYGPQVNLIGPYLSLRYIRNSGAAFSMFDTNGPVLLLLIAVAVGVIIYLYARMANSGPLVYKIIFGLIIGGALGNILDRFTHGSVVDFIWFQIPQISFSFAIFNLADSAICVSVIILFLMLTFSGFRKQDQDKDNTTTQTTEKSASDSLLAVNAQETDAHA